MKIVILCGGLGTRLREHTEFIPKPMVPIGGVPVVEHIMRHYRHHFPKAEFILCTGYKGEVIAKHFAGRERIHIIDTGQTTMTGARLSMVEVLLHETFALTYGDGLSDVDLTAELKYHKKSGCDATVCAVREPSRFGQLVIRKGRVMSFHEKPAGGGERINGGYFFMEPRVLHAVSADPSCVLEKDALPAIAKMGELAAYPHDGFWQPMDTYRDWLDLENKWATGKAPWKH